MTEITTQNYSSMCDSKLPGTLTVCTQEEKFTLVGLPRRRDFQNLSRADLRTSPGFEIRGYWFTWDGRVWDGLQQIGSTIRGFEANPLIWRASSQ